MLSRAWTEAKSPGTLSSYYAKSVVTIGNIATLFNTSCGVMDLASTDLH